MTTGPVEEKEELVEPGAVRLARAGSGQMMRTAEVRSARPPDYLVQAAARVDSGAELSLARTDATQAAQVELAGRTLVGTVVANAVVSQYVREAIIESDKTMMALTTSAPTSLIEVTATDAEAEVEYEKNDFASPAICSTNRVKHSLGRRSV